MTWWAAGNAREEQGPQAREAGRPDRRLLGVSRAGVGPAPTGTIFLGRLVIVFGTTGGIFLYNGQPSSSNPPVLWAVPPTVTTDPYGNAVTPVLGVGTPGGAGLQVDAVGNLTLTGPDGSKISEQTAANLPFSLTSALTGIMQTILAASTTDVNQVQAGVVSGIVLGSGTAAKMGTLITSPYGSTGMGLLLEAENDGSTDTPYGTFGTVSTQGGVLTFSPVLALLPGAMLLYQTSAAVTVVTKTVAGAYSIPVPAGVTVGKGECWAGGQPGGVGSVVIPGGGGGGGGGEYAAEPSLAVTGGGTVTGTVGAAGAATTMTGSAVTITANPGTAGTAGNPGGRGSGGTGSANTVHHDGGRGGLGGQGGGGGGSSAGTTANGNQGSAGGPSSGGPGGAAPSGGGAGGPGGAPGAAGHVGGTPGAGGGGGGQSGGAAAGGAIGQARLTYSSAAPAFLMTVATAAGTDQFGTAYSAGMHIVTDNTYRAERLSLVTSSNFAGNSTSPLAITGLQANVTSGVSYRVRGMINIAQGTVTSGQRIAFSGSATVSSMRISGRYADTTALTQGNPIEITALAGTPQAQNMTANDIYDFWFEGVINVNGTGTFGPTIQNLTATDTCTIGANSVMDLMPV